MFGCRGRNRAANFVQIKTKVHFRMFGIRMTVELLTRVVKDKRRCEEKNKFRRKK